MNHLELEHPTCAQLTAFGLGQLTEEELAEIEGHLAFCTVCRSEAESVADDTLIALLRSASTAPARVEPNALQQLPTGTALDSAAVAPETGSPPVLPDHPRYRVVELLGVGGMGAVYKAHHLLMERPVALKVINRELIDKPATSERFRREVRAAGQLTHPNIVTAFDAEQAGDAHFLVMEYVDGVSLGRRVAEQGPLSVPEACDYVRQAALGLQHAHERGMVHRDIKPHNLMLTPAGQVKILDFGLARFALESAPAGALLAAADEPPTAARSAEPVTQTGMVMGTPDYIAPEQARDSHSADIRADIYSLGCTFYDLLAGQAPFPKGTAVQKVKAHMEQTPQALSAIRRDVPPELNRVIERMMAKDPAERFQTPDEVVEALAPFLATARKPPWRKRLLVAGAACALYLIWAIIYFQTDKGEFVIETNSDQVALMINDKGIKIRDLAANREYLLKIGRHRIRAGEYEIDVQELPDGVEFSTKSFSLKRGANTSVSVSFNTKKDPGYLKDEAFRWFPADATFFAALNMEAFPEIARLHLLLLGEAGDDRFRRLLALAGQIDRVSVAYVANRERPEQSRTFMRLTGSIKPTRVVDLFRREWKGFSLEQTESQGQQITVIHDSEPGGGALALIGTTDLVLAGYFESGKTKNDLPVVRQCLDLRAGRGASVPAAHAKALDQIPADAWMLSVGETPAIVKKALYPAILHPARSMVMSVSGTSDVEIRVRGTFANASDAKLFMTISNLMKQAFTNAPAVLKNSALSAAVDKAVKSMRVESDADRFTVSFQIPSVAMAALLDKMLDMPPGEIPTIFKPTKQSNTNGPKAPGYLKDEALRWFPADATYFSAGNMTVFPELSQLQRLLWMEMDGLAKHWAKQNGDRFRKFADLIGPIDRIAFAHAVDRQQLDRSRYFIRLTGSIGNNRLVDYFRRDWTGLTIEQIESNGEPVILIHDSPTGGELGTALALIGTTDLLYAGYYGTAKNHLEVLQQSLELRAGRVASLSVGQAKALEEIPASAWVFGIGELPVVLKQDLFPAFLRPARSLVMSVSGTTDIAVRFRGSFASKADSTLFLTYLELLKRLFQHAPGVINDPELSAGVAKAIANLQVRSEADRITVNVQIPSVASAALMKKLQDIPIRVWLDPVKEK